MNPRGPKMALKKRTLQRLWTAALSAVTAAVVLSPSSGLAGPTSSEEAKIKAEIAKVTQANITGFETRNLELIMSAYSPGEDLLVVDITPPLKYVGAKALRQLNERWLKMFTGKVEGSYEDLNITVAGDVVYGYNTQHWKFTREDGSTLVFTTRLTDVYRKIGGRWRIVQEHGSLPVDLASLKPVLDAK